jgi:hypothetical protein
MSDLWVIKMLRVITVITCIVTSAIGVLAFHDTSKCDHIVI